MATLPTLARSASRGSKHELSYASPLVVRVRGDQPDRESLERHDSKRRSRGFNDEDGKIGQDGRKRRSRGSSDDEGQLTEDNLHNEDLRVGGPYLCSIPTTSVVVPRDHPKFRLTCIEYDEGRELSKKILSVIDKYHLNQDDIGIRFSFLGRRSMIDPEPQPCLTLWIPANRETVDNTWLRCARELRGLLVSNGLASCSVEIADPIAFTPMKTFPVLQEDKIFQQWEPLLKELLGRLDLTSVRSIGCFRRGRSSEHLDCAPTVLILVDRNQDWTEAREKVVSILKTRRLQMVAVEIVMDRPVYQAPRRCEGISTGLLEGFRKNDGRTMATQSIASSQNHDGSGTLGCFVKLKHPSSDQWETFALTCWHMVVPPLADLSHRDKGVIKNWNKDGITPNRANNDIDRLLLVDHPTRLAYREQVSKMEEDIQDTERWQDYRSFQQLELDEALEVLSSPQRRRYEKTKADVKQQKVDIQALHDCFKGCRQLLGPVFAGSGFKQKNYDFENDSVDYPTHLDWALVNLSPARRPSNEFFDEKPSFIPERFAMHATLQSIDLHGQKVFMNGYRSGKSIGVYHALRVANIATNMEDGVVTTVTTLEYSISGVGGKLFSTPGDSGAMVGCKREAARGELQRLILGMVFAGFEKEGITRFTRADLLIDDIKEVTKARDIEVLWD
ncbi:hypothetical protein N7517_010096 [Penicillium concentricum]|uniref:Uncharacterized protein n=1 Tax=Penicillium concentricum TaxID=293559 RepID=A0A9W9RIN4_9EURO|nr:uncharacterized protein N7517_010096 [Penicillium concentricum]KAJ5360905.1 hypothetical protein N7517_010096 [Penicillium concentricum]